MKILIFISKKIGLKFTKVLFEKFPEDEYLFIISNPDSDEIINEIKNKDYNFLEWNKKSIDYISNFESGHFDWLLNLWGSHILTKQILDKARETLNIHPSYLPYCRGSDPIVWAIRNNYPIGATLHKITTKVDEGDIFYQEKIPYDFPITGKKLYSKVIKLCWKIFYTKWPLIRTGHYKSRKQREIKGNKTNLRKYLFIDNKIDLSKNKNYLNFLNHILAHDFGKNFSLKVVHNSIEYDIKLKVRKTVLSK